RKKPPEGGFFMSGIPSWIRFPPSRPSLGAQNARCTASGVSCFRAWRGRSDQTVAVSMAEQVEDAVQAQGGDRLLGRLLDQRFGTEGHAKTCQAEHRQVVGAVAHGDGLLQLQPFPGG